MSGEGKGPLMEGEQRQNLWQKLLGEVQARGEIRPAHLLLLGDRGAGKRSLIKSLNKPFIKHSPQLMQIFDELGSDYSLFESSYIYMRDISEYGELVNTD